MLNLNYNIIGAKIDEGYKWPDSASIDYIFTSSVIALGLETNTQLTVEISSSQAPRRREYATFGSLNGVPYKERKIKARPSSSVNVYYQGLGPWDTTNVPSGSTFPIVEYILVGGGAGANRTGGSTGGGGGQGGVIATGSFQIPFTQYQSTMSLSIPQIGYNNTTQSYSSFYPVTQSLLTASFTASANTKYDILATSSINPFVYKVKVLQVGASGSALAGRELAGSNNLYTFVGTNTTASYQSTVVAFLSLDNPNVSSSIGTFGESNALPWSGITGSGQVYALGGVAEAGSPPPTSTPGGQGLTWLNNEVYGSGGGAGRGEFQAPTTGGLNAGNGGSSNGRTNYGGGGGGSDFTAGAGTLGGGGGSGVAIFRFYDPSGSYVSTGGIRTVTGSYVYHTFITGSQEFNITVPAAIPY